MTSRMKSGRWLLLGALVVALAVVPAVAAAEEQSPPAGGWAEPLKPLLEQLNGLRQEHLGVIEELRAQCAVNQELARRIRALLGAGGSGPRQELSALVTEFQAYTQSELRPLAQQLSELRTSMAEARQGGDREALARLREEFVQAREALKGARGGAGDLRAAIKGLRDALKPVGEAVKGLREDLAALREQAPAIRERIAALRERKAEAWEELRAARAAKDLGACRAALEEIIELKTEIVGLTADLLELAEQAGGVLSQILEALEG